MQLQDTSGFVSEYVSERDRFRERLMALECSDNILRDSFGPLLLFLVLGPAADGMSPSLPIPDDGKTIGRIPIHIAKTPKLSFSSLMRMYDLIVNVTL